MPHINNKGLLEWDRMPKDPYYYYKAMLTASPFIKILGASVIHCVADSGDSPVAQKIQVASNAKEVELWVNGQKHSTINTENGIAVASIAFTNGHNTMEAKAIVNGQSISDKKEVDYKLQPYSFSQYKTFEPLNILMGAKRTFVDSKGQLWIANKAYTNGSWGAVGGKPFKLPKGQLPYGTDKTN